jgi:hypothetical protein
MHFCALIEKRRRQDQGKKERKRSQVQRSANHARRHMAVRREGATGAECRGGGNSKADTNNERAGHPREKGCCQIECIASIFASQKNRKRMGRPVIDRPQASFLYLRPHTRTAHRGALFLVRAHAVDRKKKGATCGTDG